MHSTVGWSMGLHWRAKSGRSAAVSSNFFESYALAKRAMKDNLFTEVYLSTAVTTPVQLKGWVNQPNPYERHGQRWHLYLSRVEILRRLAARNRKNLAKNLSSPSVSPVEDRPA
jgi:hypothetical protein